jgi:diguanylate cyclase (GGDEF)-like protein
MPSSSDDYGPAACNTAPVGVIVCILFMAGGLYWTAAVGLLTFSALKAYPVLIWMGGSALALVVLGTSFWASRGPAVDPSDQSLSQEFNRACTATYDSVTGLPTNRLFRSLLNQALFRAGKDGRQVAILVVEMDDFTLSTELHGQVNPNLIYRIQAARVKSALRTTDCVARLAERTFAVLLADGTNVAELVAAATKMQAMVSLPFTHDGYDIFLTSRIGIGLSTSDDIEAGSLLDSAAQAVATARAEGYALYGLRGAVSSPHVDSSSTIAA